MTISETEPAGANYSPVNRELQLDVTEAMNEAITHGSGLPCSTSAPSVPLSLATASNVARRPIFHGLAAAVRRLVEARPTRRQRAYWYGNRHEALKSCIH